MVSLSSRLICVIGSSNTDMVVRGERIPAPGETITGGEFHIFPGGKGANQAVAAARLGGKVRLVACVGDDSFGRESIERFKAEGIECDFILTDPVVPSGVAMITVDVHGENSIIVAPGANSRLTPEHVRAVVQSLPEDAIVLLQLEIPLETVDTVITEAHSRGQTIILNPAPAQKLPEHWYRRVSVITPNETEARLLTGVTVHDYQSAQVAAGWFHQAGVETVIITLGEKGVWLSGPAGSGPVSAIAVTASDTTGAGDCLSGALAVALAEGMAIEVAARFACVAATISVTRMGAQPSMPSRSELESFTHSITNP